MSRKKVVLAYSGGLDTSVILKWLIEEKGYDVVAYAADLGQGSEVNEIKKKAKATGAIKTVILDQKEEFVRDFVFPAIRMNAIYEGIYLMGTSLARPCIARGMIEVAKREGAEAVSHGATGKGNDQVRFEVSCYALKPDIEVIAPWREWDFKGREDLLAYAKKHGIPVPKYGGKPYSSDRNLFHISFESGILEDPWAEPPENIYQMSVSPEKAPNKATYIEITFKNGNPIAVNGQKLSPAKLLTKLNEIGGKNGVGRSDCVENRYVGMKSRGVYETPGGTIMHIAHRALETITLDREVMHLRDQLIPRYAEMCYYGYWYTPEREMIQTACDDIQKWVNGVVRLKLYKGNCAVVGRKSPNSLYRPDIVTMGADKGAYNQADATGFIKLNSLRLRIRGMVSRPKF
ncbi:TPA: argininosuccinate synthase [bacterium]|nr:MAG: argininosuccinate synthase [Candidatus Hydrogenedentes bacterium CG1_02_42_14]PIU48786.1 MAG: argininosuccinate synthase [Candidatus Hydrogenedentes bacterium CG07_land_8_20_14_0_80_42_17]HBW46871.1 argininosuccinate synthase [bacterium]